MNTISSTEFRVNETNKWKLEEDGKIVEKTWWEIRPFMLQTPVFSWTEIKAFIIKICKGNKRCKGKISNWERTIKAVDKKVENDIPTSN